MIELSHFKVDIGVSAKNFAYVYHEDKDGVMWIEIWAYDDMGREVYHKTHRAVNKGPKQKENERW